MCVILKSLLSSFTGVKYESIESSNNNDNLKKKTKALYRQLSYMHLYSEYNLHLISVRLPVMGKSGPVHKQKQNAMKI